MKRKVLCFLLCVSFFVCSLSLNSSAADRYFTDEYDFYASVYEGMNVGDQYFLLAGDEATSSSDFDMSLFATTAADPLYPNFKNNNVLNDIDLNTIPSNIYNIIHSGNRLIIIRVLSSQYRIWVLRNGYAYFYATLGDATTKYQDYFGLGTYLSSSSDSSVVAYQNASCCYTAVYNYDGSISVDWSEYTKVDITSSFCNSDCFKRYVGVSENTTKYDFYQIGNGNLYKGSTKVNAIASSGSSYSLQAKEKLNSTMVDGMYLSTDELIFPSYDSQSSNTQKGILATLKDFFSTVKTKFDNLSSSISTGLSDLGSAIKNKLSDVSSAITNKLSDVSSAITNKLSTAITNIKNIPDWIADKLKSLFIPAEGYLSSVSDDMGAFFTDHLGILWEIPTFFIDILDQFINFKPVTHTYKISFPEVKPFYINSSGEKVTYTLFDSQVYKFDSLFDDPSISRLYDLYKSFVYLSYTLMLLYLIYRKYEKVFGGK